MSKRPFCGSVSVAGVGLRQYKRGTAPMPEQGVLVRAIVDACEEAGFDPAEIDGFVAYGDDKNEPVRLMPDLGTRELRYNAQVWGGGGGGIAGAFGIAAAAIATGQANAVVVFRALVQDNSGRLSAAVMRHHLNDYIIGAGVLAPANVCAMRANRLFEHHGVPRSVTEDLVRASYYHGSRNPEAMSYGKELDLEAYRHGRWISEPFRLFDCSRESDGAGALLLVSTERARDLKSKPIRLLGVANGTSKGWGDLLENDDASVYATAGFSPIAKRLWEQTGLTPADVDVVQLYENFSAQGVASLIDHGFCTIESAAEVIRYDNLIAPTGKLPVNTAGGNFAHGFVHGMGMAVEAVRVLRGDSANPVPDAKVCLLAGGPGAPTVSSALFGTEDL